ncbi:hypothetical protein Tco_0276939 [Tanacetum coccineum]
MDDPNITMEEYIMLEEEKAHRCVKVYYLETATYGKIWYDEDVHNLRSVETKFPAIVFNDSLTSNETPSCEPTVSSLNDEIDFRISFDESDDEDYTVVFDKNSFSYKIFSTNDLKTDSENDNEKVNKPLFPSPEPTVSYLDDLDFFKDFENEIPVIVYNDALTSKSDFLTEPTLNYGVLDFDESKDHSPDFPKNTPYHEGFKSNTPYPGTSIRCIQDLLYTKLMEDIKRGPYSKKPQYVSHQHLSDEDQTMKMHLDTGALWGGDAPKQQQQYDSSTTAISNIKNPNSKDEELLYGQWRMEHYLEYFDNEVWKEIQLLKKKGNPKHILLEPFQKKHMRRFHGMDEQRNMGSHQN